MFKAYLICLIPIVILWWLATCCVIGFIYGTIIMVCSIGTLSILVWWVKFCADHFSDKDFD